MIRLAWPAYTNEVVFLFHATAIVYFALPVIGEQKDLMIKAKELFERDYNAFLHFSVAALYFLAVSLVVFFLFGLVYRAPDAPHARPTPPALRAQVDALRFTPPASRAPAPSSPRAVPPAPSSARWSDSPAASAG